jgi:selenide, water dikinase
MGPLDLEKILAPLSGYSHPDLLVGLTTGDDAAVFRLGDQAIIQTVDFFAPVVDDPYTYGAVAAANSMSDVYAMGGEVLFALNVAAFPEDLPPEVISAILQGGVDKVVEAGGLIVGGHTVIDREPKYGLCVTGIGKPEEIATKGGARTGDALILTKPIGTGAITTAHKAEVVAPEHLKAAVDSMLLLNRDASRMLRRAGITGCTDITGFGLLGHASEVAAASGVRIRIEAGKVPLLPGAMEYSRDGVLPGGVGRNRAYLLGTGEGSTIRATLSDDVAPELADLLMDPQTSGGLLASVPRGKLGPLLDEFEAAGHGCWVIGEVLPGAGVEVV